MYIFGYSLLALVLFYLFLLWQFPYEGIKRAIIQSLEEAVPLTLTISQARPSLPFKISLEEIQLKSQPLVIQLPDVAVGANLWKFFLGQTDIKVSDLKTAHRLQGEFKADTKRSWMKMRLNNLEVKASSPNEYTFFLRVSGEMTLQWVGESYDKVSGQAWTLIQRGEVQAGQGKKIPIPLTLFDMLRAEIQVQDGNLMVKKLVLSGKGMKEIILQDFQLPLSGLEKGGFPDLSLFSQIPLK